MTRLITSLEQAGEGSRELDAMLFRHFGSELPTAFGPVRIDLAWQDDGSALMPVGDLQVRFSAPPVTTSLDAALALAERVHPGLHAALYTSDGDKSRQAMITVPTRKDGPFNATAATIPLALCIAILRATHQETT